MTDSRTDSGTDSGTDGRTGVSKERAIAYMLSRAKNVTCSDSNYIGLVMFVLTAKVNHH